MDNDAAIHAAIHSRYAELDAAAGSKDVTRFFRHFLPDYIDKHGKRILSRDEAIENVAFLFKSSEHISATTSFIEIAIEGDKVTANVYQEWKMHFPGFRFAWLRSIILAIIARDHAEDVWVMRAGGWHFQSSRTLSSKWRFRIQRRRGDNA